MNREAALRRNAPHIPFNTPNATVCATVFASVFTTDARTYTDVLVTLDDKGIHGTCILDGVLTPLTRLNSHLDALVGSYAFDAS